MSPTLRACGRLWPDADQPRWRRHGATPVDTGHAGHGDAVVHSPSAPGAFPGLGVAPQIARSRSRSRERFVAAEGAARVIVGVQVTLRAARFAADREGIGTAVSVGAHGSTRTLGATPLARAVDARLSHVTALTVTAGPIGVTALIVAAGLLGLTAHALVHTSLKTRRTQARHRTAREVA